MLPWISSSWTESSTQGILWFLLLCPCSFLFLPFTLFLFFFSFYRTRETIAFLLCEEKYGQVFTSKIDKWRDKWKHPFSLMPNAGEFGPFSLWSWRSFVNVIMGSRDDQLKAWRNYIDIMRTQLTLNFLLIQHFSFAYGIVLLRLNQRRHNASD